MEKIRIGIIGMGRMGITHYAIINSHPDVQIVSVSDTSKMMLDINRKFNPNLEVYSDYKQMIKKSSLDGIIICTPPALHYGICKAACEKGIAVFCEKPFTANLDQARELTEMFQKADLVNQVGYVNRFNDVFVKVRELIQAGILGKIARFKSEMFSATVIKPSSGSGWRSKRAEGGGVTYEMATHALDLVNYFLGKPSKVTGAAMTSVYSKTVEDAVSATLLYDDGKCGTIYVNWSDTSYRKPSNKIDIFGTGGKLLADQHGMKIFMNSANDKYKLRKGWNTIYITDVFRPVPFYVRGNEFTRQLYQFADAIKSKNTDTLCGFKDGLAVQEIVHNIFTACGVR